jgi:formate--tetrahydrofolate ligase
VLVATSQSLKLHGGVEVSAMSQPDLNGLKKGVANLKRHLENLQNFGQKVIVAFNRYHFDQADEIAFLQEWCAEQNVRFAVNDSFARGGDGAIELAKTVASVVDQAPSGPLTYAYELNDPIETKIEKVVTGIYGGDGVRFLEKARAAIRQARKEGQSDLPVCIAKTQYSFSDDPSKVGVATGFTLRIEDVILNRGAGFLVAVAGEIMRMPGLPKEPQARQIDLIDGQIEGLS